MKKTRSIVLEPRHPQVAAARFRREELEALKST